MNTDWDGWFVFCTNATWSVSDQGWFGVWVSTTRRLPQLKEILRYLRENPMPLFAPSDSFFDSGDYPAWRLPLTPLKTDVPMSIWNGVSTDRANNETIPGEYSRSSTSRTANRVEVARLWGLPALRRLGVCLWDLWRMCSAGLMECPTGRVATQDGSFIEKLATIQHYLRQIKPWLALIGKEMPCD